MQVVNPIREIQKIEDMKKLIDNKRDLLLFVMGINTALRVSDLLKLTLGDVVDERGEVREAITLKEQKTGKTKDLPLNDAIGEAVRAYVDERRGRAYLTDDQRNGTESPLFLSRKGDKPINRGQAWQILHNLGRRAGLEKIGTHTLRKTFGYHVYMQSGKDLGLVQKLLNHSSSAATLRYIGIEREQMDDVYKKLNL
jgi:integrase